jgi:hypothetical protein
MPGRAQWVALVCLIVCSVPLASCTSSSPPTPTVTTDAPQPPTSTSSPRTSQSPPTVTTNAPQPPTSSSPPTSKTGGGRQGGATELVKFELPTVDADYAQKDQWIERLVNNCDEALHQRGQCVKLEFTFFTRENGRKRQINDPGPDYDSDVLGNCTVTKMSEEGRRGKQIPVGTVVRIEVVCAQP